MFTKDILLLLWLITAAFLYCGSSLAFSVLQFDASAFRNVSEFNSTVSSWRSIQGGVSISPCHTISNGWAMPLNDSGAICFIANSGYHQGYYLNQYIGRRPIIQPEGE